MKPPALAEAYVSRPESVAAIRARAESYAAQCGLPATKVEAIKTAVSEAATNAIVHGYGGTGGEVRLTAELADGVLVVVIADEGRGMLPRRGSSGLGLGLPLMSTLADHVNIISPAPGGGTEVQMHFTCDAPPPGLSASPC